VPANDRVLIDYRTADDAGVYKLDDERALVQTVDFFTPIVDDPFVYGQIAAANALSDVYAMGGRPLTALAIAAFPNDLESSVLATIFAGGVNMLQRASVALLGGHTVQDREIKFGYAVTGEVHPRRIWANSGARAGDVLFLTKALGTGIIATALKSGRAPDRAVASAVTSMLMLNRAASEALQRLAEGAVHACTDVTGFGLVGHACEMAVASNVTVRIHARAVPLLDGVMPLVRDNVPGGGKTNAEHFGPNVRTDSAVDLDLVKVLHDPQTSGGLLIAADPRYVTAVASALTQAGEHVHQVGQVVPYQEHRIILT
jgi:selenide, water dikinase